MRRHDTLLIGLSGLLGVLAAALAMYAAWQLNPQCAIHCPSLGILWGDWLAIGASWLLAVWLAALVIGGGIFVMYRSLRRHSSPDH